MAENFYQILGVDQASDEDEIRGSYKALLSIHNTQYSHLDDASRELEIKKLNDAFTTLIDARRRIEYNQLLAGQMQIESEGAEKNTDTTPQNWGLNQLGSDFLPNRTDFLNWSLIRIFILFCTIVAVIVYFFVH